MPLAERELCRACGGKILLSQSFRMVPGAWFHLDHYHKEWQDSPKTIITRQSHTTTPRVDGNHVLTQGV